MITPRATRLVRVGSLRAFQRAVAVLSCCQPEPARADTVVLVPTESAASELRRTLRDLLVGEGWRPDGPTRDAVAREAAAFADGFDEPLLRTRDGWYTELFDRAPPQPPRLTAFEQEALMHDAALRAIAAGSAPPFALRPGFIAETLALYDGLRRRYREVEQFERLTAERLESSAEIDRGARRLLQQTRFLAATFREYEARVAATGRSDEHTFRETLAATGLVRPVRQVVVTTADQHADPSGLWLADLTLLSRLPGLERVDIVATETMLASGWLERLLDIFPEIDVVRLEPGPSAAPTLLAPPPVDGPPYFVVRDREEEVVLLARTLRQGEGEAPLALEAAMERAERTAFVFQRPLPYLYLARSVLEQARLPYQAFDAVPLASEPFCAVFDLIASTVLLDWTRAALVSLLRSPFLDMPSIGALRPEDATRFDRALRDAEFFGGRAPLLTACDALDTSLADEDGARRAVRAARAVVDRLAPLEHATSSANHLAVLWRFIEEATRVPPIAGAAAERNNRARQALLQIIDAVRASYEAFGDRPAPLRDVVMTVRRWIEAHTFHVRTGDRGVHLLDAQAARYGAFADVHLAGLIEGEWQAGSARNVFYPTSLLQPLGWPKESDRQEGARAAFRELLELPAARLRVSTVSLEDDTLVRVSPLVEELAERPAPVVREVRARAPLLVDEALALEAERAVLERDLAARWLAHRRARDEARPAGRPSLAPGALPDALAVTRLETYLQCPFRYFAANVLRLEEEPRDEVGLSPMQRGEVLHDVFETFFERWHAERRGAITTETIGQARALFATLLDERLAQLPPEERGIERDRLWGSAAATGFAERVFRHEVERPSDVVERLLEFRLDGSYTFTSGDVSRSVRVRGVADRIDLTADGSLRIYDYKSTRAPHQRARLQLPIYARCAEQRLDGHHNRAWQVSEAGYMAVRDDDGYVSVIGARAPREKLLEEGEARLLTVVGAIERGEFPVRPLEPFRCTFCPYPAVCRKDYVGDE